MQILHRFVKQNIPSIVTVGMFDGVHRGHQKILRSVVRDATRLGSRPVVLTFADHPQKVTGGMSHVALITTMAQKLRLFERLGFGAAVIIPFNKKFSRISPESFVREILIKRLRMQKLCVGYDFAFGKDRRGNLDLLAQLSRECGFDLRIFPASRRRGDIVSSTAIRKFLAAGKLRDARQFLGRDYSMQGVVVPGRGVGRTLGYPTANLRMDNEEILPDGVYAVYVTGAGRGTLAGVLNAGVRPTFSAASPIARRTWELHIWDFHKHLVGKKLEIFFVKCLRAEKRFHSVAALTKQIARDVCKAKSITRKGMDI